MNRTLCRAMLALALVAITPQAGAETGVCPRAPGVIHGLPLTIEFEFALPDHRAPDPGLLFPDAPDYGGDVAGDASCSQGGIVGAINCLAEGMALDLRESAAIAPIVAAARAAAADAAGSGASAPPPRRLVQSLVLRPLIAPGSPGTIRLEPVGPGALALPEGGFRSARSARSRRCSRRATPRSPIMS